MLEVLRIGIQSPIETMKVNLITAISICGLNNHVVHGEVAFDIRSLIFLHFRLRNLFESGVPAGRTVLVFNCILKQNLYFVHLEFCRSDLNWVWLTILISCWLVYNTFYGLPRRLLLSIKLFSNLWSCLKNLWTYWMMILRLFRLIDKGLSISQRIEL